MFEMPAAPETTFVVYDRTTGEIVLIHHFSATPGVKLPPPEELEELALSHAATEESRAPSSLAAIQVRLDDLKPQTTYKVSPTNGTLIPQRPLGL
jgi:hypothetical protein